jgi:hypothetical protein
MLNTYCLSDLKHIESVWHISIKFVTPVSKVAEYKLKFDKGGTATIENYTFSINGRKINKGFD